MGGKSATLGFATRGEAATEELRRRILSGEWPEGFQLKQDLLAEEFGLSRIPIRVALVQLEAEGLVMIVAHKGAIVSALSPDDIGELFSLRAVLEPHLLKRSIPRLEPADFARLDKILAEFAAELQTLTSRRWGESNAELHGILLSRADRPRALEIVGTLLQQTDRRCCINPVARARHDDVYAQRSGQMAL
ncbi:GntR family transcriptional regulator [Ralstonia syzygii]|uniref:GntR family transcriptional regulator n=1 Tax=Ralstonia syzygii TaxID=28097 RepID=UPI0018D18438|nr:GntR family transcriptional regulator [Ralstonia syzygii]